jgi:hypothetical protein
MLRAYNSRIKCQYIWIEPHFASSTGEHPDVFGIRSGASVLAEAKVSRSDFLSDKNKSFRQNPELGMGTFRCYFIPVDTEIITVDDLPAYWGLIEVDKDGAGNILQPPTRQPELKSAVNSLLYSTIRRKVKARNIKF